MSFGERQPMVLGIDLSDSREPDVIVEGEIKQRAVEVEQHGIDLVPAGRLFGAQ